MPASRVGNEELAAFLGTRWTKPRVWFEVENVRAAYAALAAHNLTFLCEPFEARTGLTVEFEDPFGNRLGHTDCSRMLEHSHAKMSRATDGK